MPITPLPVAIWLGGVRRRPSNLRRGTIESDWPARCPEAALPTERLTATSPQRRGGNGPSPLGLVAPEACSTHAQADIRTLKTGARSLNWKRSGVVRERGAQGKSCPPATRAPNHGYEPWPTTRRAFPMPNGQKVASAPRCPPLHRSGRAPVRKSRGPRWDTPLAPIAAPRESVCAVRLERMMRKLRLLLCGVHDVESCVGRAAERFQNGSTLSIVSLSDSANGSSSEGRCCPPTRSSARQHRPQGHAGKAVRPLPPADRTACGPAWAITLRCARRWRTPGGSKLVGPNPSIVPAFVEFVVRPGPWLRFG